MSRARNRADANAPDDSITSADLAPDIVLTGGSVGIPSVTTANRPGESGGTNASQTATVGMIIYNSTIGMLQQYNAQGWAAIDSPPTVTSLDYPGDDTALDTVGEYNDATCDYNNDPTIAHDANSNMKVGMSVSGTGIPAGATIASVTSTTAFELSASTTGGAVTNGTLTFNTQTLIIAGTNFQVGITVTIDGTAPSTVTRNSSTQITVTGTPAKTTGTKVDGLVVTNTSGLAASINIDYSALPAWTTSSGNVLNAFQGTITEIDLVATSATSYAITTGALPAGLTIGSSDGDINGNMTAAAATYNFTVTATDAEAQSSPRLFNIISKGALPTGGTIIESGAYNGDYRSHTFFYAGNGTSANDFIVSVATNVDWLVVGGGGGGGANMAGGGGGGGFRTGASHAVTAQTYTITVGASGAGGYQTYGTNGGSSNFDTVTSLGGGGGGKGSTAATTGVDGGSGGGGAANNVGSETAGGSATGISPITGETTSVQGYGGGTGGGNVSGQWAGAGGGGAGTGGADGVSGTSGSGGNGGTGIANYFRDGVSGTTLGIHLFGGGGGGAKHGSGGAGSATHGGGAGSTDVSGDGSNGTANTGGGGGGNSDNNTGGAGGSGIVVIRYAV